MEKKTLRILLFLFYFSVSHYFFRRAGRGERDATAAAEQSHTTPFDHRIPSQRGPTINISCPVQKEMLIAGTQFKRGEVISRAGRRERAGDRGGRVC